MPTIRTFVPVFLALGLVTATALADTVSMTTAKVTVDVPAGWTSSQKTGQLQLADPKGDIAVNFVTVPAGSVKDAGTAAGRELGKLIDKIVVKEQKAVTVNGMPASLVDGDGRLKGVDIDWMVMFVDTPSTDSDLMIITIAEDAKLAAHKSEVKFVFDHIKPAP
jgi:hypothetical protein